MSYWLIRLKINSVLRRKEIFREFLKVNSNFRMLLLITAYLRKLRYTTLNCCNSRDIKSAARTVLLFRVSVFASVFLVWCFLVQRNLLLYIKSIFFVVSFAETKIVSTFLRFWSLRWWNLSLSLSLSLIDLHKLRHMIKSITFPEVNFLLWFLASQAGEVLVVI